MAASDRFTEIEDLYRSVIRLTEQQEQCLLAGDLAALPGLLSAKAENLGRAQALTAAQAPQGAVHASPERRAGLARVAATLQELIAAEERCRRLVPNPQPPPPRAQALRAYGGAATGPARKP